jgi:arylsulfatase A-like enzyme
VTDGFAVPAPRYARAFQNEPLPTEPSFNEKDMSDKPPFMRHSINFRRLTDSEIEVLTSVYRHRLASLLSIDDAVEQIVQALANSNQLDNTVIIFTSDNGYFLGQHRIPFGKYLPYEEAIRVPLVIRGPGLAQDRVQKSMVGNVDLAPTILELARARPLRVMDGRSLVPLMKHPGRTWHRALLLEAAASEDQTYQGIRTSKYVYIEHERGARELYDLVRDPYELRSRHKSPAFQKIRADLHRQLEDLRTCAGSTCWDPPETKRARHGR